MDEETLKKKVADAWEGSDKTLAAYTRAILKYQASRAKEGKGFKLTSHSVELFLEDIGCDSSRAKAYKALQWYNKSIERKTPDPFRGALCAEVRSWEAEQSRKRASEKVRKNSTWDLSEQQLRKKIKDKWTGSLQTYQQYTRYMVRFKNHCNHRGVPFELNPTKIDEFLGLIESLTSRYSALMSLTWYWRVLEPNRANPFQGNTCVAVRASRTQHCKERLASKTATASSANTKPKSLQPVGDDSDSDDEEWVPASSEIEEAQHSSTSSESSSDEDSPSVDSDISADEGNSSPVGAKKRMRVDSVEVPCGLPRAHQQKPLPPTKEPRLRYSSPLPSRNATPGPSNASTSKSATAFSSDKGKRRATSDDDDDDDDLLLKIWEKKVKLEEMRLKVAKMQDERERLYFDSQQRKRARGEDRGVGPSSRK